MNSIQMQKYVIDSIIAELGLDSIAVLRGELMFELTITIGGASKVAYINYWDMAQNFRLYPESIQEIEAQKNWLKSVIMAQLLHP